jgi:LmbE family N-acetylglucosaminyl deacetylase
MRKRALYLSPHLDDAALSCGGLIRRQVLGGTEVLVVTIFAGAPRQGDLSEFAAQVHVQWGNDPSPVARRTEEDRRAMDLLGAGCLHLDYPDAIYRYHGRAFLYHTDEELFGCLHPADGDLRSEVAAAIFDASSSQDSIVYAPLAVGNHVDHQLVRNALLTLHADPTGVVFYEDYPYVDRPGALTSALEALRTRVWESALQPIDEVCLNAKIEAISAYQSQVASLFGNSTAMAQRVCAYARAVSSEEGFAERYWRMRGPARST